MLRLRTYRQNNRVSPISRALLQSGEIYEQLKLESLRLYTYILITEWILDLSFHLFTFLSSCFHSHVFQKFQIWPSTIKILGKKPFPADLSLTVRSREKSPLGVSLKGNISGSWKNKERTLSYLVIINLWGLSALLRILNEEIFARITRLRAMLTGKMSLGACWNTSLQSNLSAAP